MFKRRRPIVALFASAAIALLSLVFAQPSHADTTLGPWVIQNTASQLCVQPDPNNPGPDIQLMQAPCRDAAGNVVPDAHWVFVPLGGGNYWIKNQGINQNVGTGNCMRALSNTDLSPVDSIDCTHITNSTWQLQVAPSGGHLEIISKVSGGSRCLDVLENFLTPTTMDIFHCTSNSTTTNTAQTFYVQPNPV
jgi:hypothetical protein